MDRDFAAAHHLWTCYPDGRDPRAPHANYPRLHSTMTLTPGDRWRDERMLRPRAEYELRAIPGSHKYVAVAGGHHTFADGKVVLIDARIPDDDASSQVTAVTPGCWKHGGYRTTAGKFGAHYSHLGQTLLKSHRDRISYEDFHRVTLRLDLNSHQYGAYHSTDKQNRGDIVWPLYEVDTNNPQGTELLREVGERKKHFPAAPAENISPVSVAADMLVVHSGRFDPHAFSLFTAHSRHIATFSGTGSQRYRLSTGHYAPGVYCIHGTVGQRRLSEQLIVQ